MVQWRNIAMAFVLALAPPVRAQDEEVREPSDAEMLEGENSAETKSVSAQDLLKQLTLEQKVGQLMIFGFPGQKWSPQLSGLLRRFQPGAVIVFGRNVKSFTQITHLNKGIQKYSHSLNSLPIFIMVDQEGGSVARIKTKPPMPSALSLGSAGSPELTYELGDLTGQLLATLGFNMNLAPVLDLSNPAKPSFIGNRAFGQDPATVGKLAYSFADGLSHAGIIPTGKHFPGHGGLVQDSHKRTPVKFLSLEELDRSDLIPFKQFKNLPNSAVMVAHLALPKIDSAGLPAAFSSKLTTEILRQHLGYEGLVITDDIEMMGAKFVGTMGERAVKAIEAGCDMVMVAWSATRQAAAYAGLMKAVKSGRISEARLDASVLRILKHKLSLPARSFEPDTTKKFESEIKQHLAALKKVTSKIHRLNFEKSLEALTPLTTTEDSTEQAFAVFSSDPEFYREFQSVAPDRADFIQLTHQSLNGLERQMRQNPDKICLYYASGTITARALSRLPKELKSRLIVVNATYPGAVSDPQNFRAVIQINSLEPESGRWLAENLFPKPPPEPSDANELRVPAEAEPEPPAESDAP